MNENRNQSLKTVVFVMFSNPEHDSIALNVINLLAKDFKVIIVVRSGGELLRSSLKNALVYKIEDKLVLGEGICSAFQKIVHYLKFIFEIRKIINDYNSSVLYCYNMHAFVFGNIASLFRKDRFIVYHQNETILSTEISKLTFLYLIKCFEIFFAKDVDILCFPEPNRAKCFFNDAKLKRDYFIVENCPLLVTMTPIVHPQIATLKAKGFKIVLHRGPFGHGEDVDIYTVIHAMKYVTQNVVFVNIGGYKEDEKNICMDIALENNVLNKAIFINYVSDPIEMNQYISSADIGLVLYKPTSINTKYAAPGKFYSFISYGVPVIVPKSLPYLCQLVEEKKIGLSYLQSNPENLADAINSILIDINRKEKMSKRAKEEHVINLNFEKQFSPVLKLIKNHCKK